MKMTRFNLIVLTVTMLTLAAGADEIVTNRLSFSSRFGFNISARFKNISLATPPSARTTPPTPDYPNGVPYNYDDGYVGGVGGVPTDKSGNYGGQTWYWGYDNASQISGNTILMSRTTASASGSSQSIEGDPQLGCELTYDRLLGVWGDARYGLEVAANYMNISMHGSSSYPANATRVTDAYPFTPGTTPPGTVTGPYQGSFEGPGFLIGDTPVGSTSVAVPGAMVNDHQNLDADLWGFRLGPYLEVPIGEPMTLTLSGGLAVGILDADASWSLTVGNATPLSGGGHDNAVLWGGYLSAAATWRFSENWSVIGGAQYQTLGNYQHSYGGRTVELDLSNSWFLTLGLSYTF